MFFQSKQQKPNGHFVFPKTNKHLIRHRCFPQTHNKLMQNVPPNNAATPNKKYRWVFPQITKNESELGASNKTNQHNENYVLPKIDNALLEKQHTPLIRNLCFIHATRTQTFAASKKVSKQQTKTCPNTAPKHLFQTKTILMEIKCHQQTAATLSQACVYKTQENTRNELFLKNKQQSDEH